MHDQSDSTAPAPSVSPTPTDSPQISPKLPIPEKIPGQTAQLPSPLAQKQQAALNRLLAGESDQFICQSLKIDRKTLYTWKRRHPAFMAEMTRRNQEVWSEIAADLRQAVADAVATLRRHLHTPRDPMTELRAARALINLVNSPRLAPTGPTTVAGVLDQFLRANHPAPPAAKNAPTFTDAQRQALLEQLLNETADTEFQPDATPCTSCQTPPAALSSPSDF